MNIVKSSLYFDEENYWAFSKMLTGPNYFPFIQSYEFTFSGEHVVSVETLQTIIPSRPLTGFMRKCSFADIQESVSNAMQWNVNPQGIISKISDVELIKARTFLFFDAIPLNFVYDKADYCFIYQSGSNDFFTHTTLWSFCFVLLSGDQGLAFYGKTWASAADCKPETDDEALWRKNYRML